MFHLIDLCFGQDKKAAIKVTKLSLDFTVFSKEPILMSENSRK